MEELIHMPVTLVTLTTLVTILTLVTPVLFVTLFTPFTPATLDRLVSLVTLTALIMVNTLNTNHKCNMLPLLLRASSSKGNMIKKIEQILTISFIWCLYASQPSPL